MMQKQNPPSSEERFYSYILPTVFTVFFTMLPAGHFIALYRETPTTTTETSPNNLELITQNPDPLDQQ